jgi:hypothetical protein
VGGGWNLAGGNQQVEFSGWNSRVAGFGGLGGLGGGGWFYNLREDYKSDVKDQNNYFVKRLNKTFYLFYPSMGFWLKNESERVFFFYHIAGEYVLKFMQYAESWGKDTILGPWRFLLKKAPAFVNRHMRNRTYGVLRRFQCKEAVNGYERT